MQELDVQTLMVTEIRKPVTERQADAVYFKLHADSYTQKRDTVNQTDREA